MSIRTCSLWIECSKLNMTPLSSVPLCLCVMFVFCLFCLSEYFAHSIASTGHPVFKEPRRAKDLQVLWLTHTSFKSVKQWETEGQCETVFAWALHFVSGIKEGCYFTPHQQRFQLTRIWQIRLWANKSVTVNLSSIKNGRVGKENFGDVQKLDLKDCI